MTLYRQLFAYTCTVLLCLSVGLWVGELMRTRSFINDQLASHAQDTATSLGLSLSSIADETDLPTMKSMVSALFDRGFYQRIQLRTLNDNVLIEQTNEITIKGVPNWFISLFPLAAPQAEAAIMRGWQQTGTVTVGSHPGYAYRTLWRAAVDASLFFTGTLFVVTLLGGLGLRNLLRPLVNLEEQAMALADRQFHIQDELPRTRELRRIVSAMNRASERLRDMFHEQTALADSLMQQAYQDPLTALGNRRFLEAQILAKVTSKLNKLEGAFLLVQIQGVHQMNQRQGYESGDQLIKQTAQIIKQVLAETGEPIIARLAGGDFAILLLNISPNKAKQIGANILELHSLTETSREQRLTCGGVTFQSSTTSQSLLSAADQALASARYQDKASPTIIPLDDHTLLKSEGSHARKSALEAILTNRAITLYYQPTVQHDNLADIFHIEILTRMTDSAGSHLSIGSIIPIAEQFRMMPLLDRLILETIFAIPKNHLQPPRIAVNVSPLSLEDPEFFSWLVSQLNECSTMGITLFFEFPEFKAIRHQRIINLFASQIKELGHGIGIDHFGQGLIHFGYLNSVLPHYVKIDRAITQDLWNKHSDSSFFVNALCTVAHSLDIRVIVEGVETEAQWQAISGMHVDAVQGFFVQRPKPLSLAEKQPNG